MRNLFHSNLSCYSINNSVLPRSMLDNMFINLYGSINLNLYPTLPSSISMFGDLLEYVTDMKRYSVSVHLFKQMCGLIGAAVVLNHTKTLNTVIKCYSKLDQTKQGGFTLLGYSIKTGYNTPRISTYNALLKGFIRQGLTHEANTLFNNLFIQPRPKPNIITYNTMIKGHCKIGNNYTAIALLRLMDGRGCIPNHVSYRTIIHSLCHDLLIDDALKLFKQMVSHQNIPPPDVDTYDSLIFALSKLGRWDHVSNILKQMVDLNIYPDMKTFHILVDSLCKEGKVKEAKAVIDIMVDIGGIYPDITIYHSLIDGHSLRGEINEAESVYDLLPPRRVQPNATTYNKLINAYRKDFKIDEAMRMYFSVSIKGVKPKPNRLAYFIALLGLSFRSRQNCLAALKPPFQHPEFLSEFPKGHPYRFFLNHHTNAYQDSLALFRFMDGDKLNSYIDVYNILIDRSAKCGHFDIATRLFHDLFHKGLQPDIHTYTAMISAFCARGLLKDAKKLFLKMENTHCPPDTVIFNHLIHGYFKNKPFDDVKMLFREMEGRSYTVNALNLSLAMDQKLSREPNNTLLPLIRKLIPKQWNEDPPGHTISEVCRYNEDPPGHTISEVCRYLHKVK